MSQCMKRNASLLRLLQKLKPNALKAVMKVAPPDLIKALSECGLNVLKGNVKLNPAQKKKLCRYKNKLRALAIKKTSMKKRKEILQSGGFIGALLTPVLSVLGSLLLGGR